MTGPLALRSATARLERVTLRARTADPLRSRLRLERELALADWSVAGLPSTALLLVRRVTVAHHVRSGSNRLALESRVTAAIDVLAESARRPWRYADAAAAEAVLFIDEAELAACLVRDWLRGTVAERWWWRSVLGKLSAREWLQAHVLPRGEVLVPVLVLLASRAEAVQWVTRLAPAEAEQALIRVIRAYGMAPFEQMSAPAVRTGRPVRDPGGREAAVARRLDGPPHTSPDVVIAACRHLVRTVPEVRDSALGEPQRRLLAAALAVARAPSWARTLELPLALGAMEQHLLSDVSAEVPPSGNMVGYVVPTPIPSPADASHDVPDTAVADVSPTARPGEGRLRVERGPRIAPVAALGPPPISTLTDLPPPTALALPAIREAPAPASEFFGVRLTGTGFGGIFYLLNTALALELYGDFTAPRASGLALLPWNWLALVGRAWFGNEFVRDPVWKVLAGLASRGPNERPDAYFAAPREWLIPLAWLAPWGKVDVLEVKATRARLRVLHPAGFLVADVPREPGVRPLAQVRALCDGYAELRGAMLRHARASGRYTAPRSPTRRWLRWLLDFLRARLAVALGLDDPLAVPAFLCRHSAEVGVSGTRVDVHLSLAELPLPIRIAGLDRDAGWIPAAGRSLHFHFA